VKKETLMLNKIMTLAAMAVLMVLVAPTKVDGWGAARVSATRVGPAGGVYHASRTAVGGVGYGGAYRSSYGRVGYGGVGYGGAYHASYGGAAGYRYGGYGYGGASYARYGYIR
jgi:hypothetical protein